MTKKIETITVLKVPGEGLTTFLMPQAIQYLKKSSVDEPKHPLSKYESLSNTTHATELNPNYALNYVDNFFLQENQ